MYENTRAHLLVRPGDDDQQGVNKGYLILVSIIILTRPNPLYLLTYAFDTDVV